MNGPDSQHTSRRRLLGLLVTSAAGLAGCSAADGSERASSGGTASTATPVPGNAGTAAPAGNGAGSARAVDADPAAVDDGTYAAIYRETIPSVVLVRVYGGSGPLGQGSGFVHPDGSHVVTNQHVVDGARAVSVRFDDGTWAEASVVGTDVYSDLAVLAADTPSSAPPLRLVDAEPAVGTRVVALGAPFSLGGSVSAGVVSGVDRSLPSQTGFSIPDALQTDAAVNPGNSGGPLVTLDGRVAAVINSGQGENVNFGISAALARRVVPALVDDGDYDHPFMGVQLLEVTPAVARANGLDAVRGVLVVDVLRNGPAAGALRGSDREATALGQRVPVGGDVVVALDGTPTPTQAALSSYLATETSPGDVLETRVIRGGRERTVPFELGTRPPPGEPPSALAPPL